MRQYIIKILVSYVKLISNYKAFCIKKDIGGKIFEKTNYTHSDIYHYFLVILYFLLIKNILALLVPVPIITFIGMIYLNGCYRYKCFKNRRKDVSFCSVKKLGFIPVFDVYFNSKEKIDRPDYLIVYSIIPILLLMIVGAFGVMNNLLISKGVISLITTKSIRQALITSVIIIAFFWIEDMISLIKVLVKFREIFIILDGNKIIGFDDDNYMYHHKNIIIMEHDYLDYSYKDLKREKFYLEGKLERARKPAFYDVYVLPLMILYTNGFIALVNIYIDNFIISTSNFNVLSDIIIFYSLISSLLLASILYISCVARKVSYESIEDLRSRILVIDDLLEEKYKECKEESYPDEI